MILSAIGVPVGYQPPIIRMMYDKAVQMTTTPANDGANLVRMEVTISVVTQVLLAAESSPSLEEQPLLFEPALERIRVKDGDPTSECIICMEELAGGTDATKMPCSHIYHVDCIKQWLERSCSCPLCRYACVRPCWSRKLDLILHYIISFPLLDFEEMHELQFIPIFFPLIIGRCLWVHTTVVLYYYCYLYIPKFPSERFIISH